MVDAEQPVLDPEWLRFESMLEVLREAANRDRATTVRELRRLRDLVARRYSPEDELVIGCERSILEYDWRSMPLQARLDALRALYARAVESLGERHRETRAIATYVASALRKIDRAEGIAAYRAEARHREDLFGRDHRSTRIARGNVAFALRSHGATVPELVEGHQILVDEWRSRREVFGDDDSFTWMSAHAYAQNCLEGALAGHPFEEPGKLVTLCEEVVDARQRLMGTHHRRTVVAKVTLAHARALAGQRESAVWSLLALRAEADAVGVDDPERIPTLLLTILGDSDDDADRRAAIGYGREALELLLEVYGPGSSRTIEVQERIGRIEAGLA